MLWFLKQDHKKKVCICATMDGDTCYEVNEAYCTTRIHRHEANDTCFAMMNQDICKDNGSQLPETVKVYVARMSLYTCKVNGK